MLYKHPSVEVNRAFFWGDPRAPSYSHGHNANLRRVDVVERCWTLPPTLGQNLDIIKERIRHNRTREDLQGISVMNAVAPGEPKGTASLGSSTAKTRWLMERLPALFVGAGITITSPTFGVRAYAVVLGVHAPSKKYESAPGLSQIAVKVWVSGEPDEISVSLLSLYADRNFMVSNRAASIDWFLSGSSVTRLALEGNGFVSQRVGRGLGGSGNAVLMDRHQGEIMSCLLPESISWDTINHVPMDLVSSTHAMDFMREHSGVTIAGGLPLVSTSSARYLQGDLLAFGNKKGVTIIMRNGYEREAKATWLGYNSGRRLIDVTSDTKTEVAPRENQKVFLCKWGDAHKLFYTMYSAGLHWRVDRKFIKWYEQTAPRLLRK